jgi:sulfate adenylyltransferase
VWELGVRQRCDLELIGSGAFAPLTTFLGRADHESVCERMRLADGSLWPVPVTLDLTEEVLRAADRSGRLLLVDGTRVLAEIEVQEAWRPDLVAEAEAVLGTTDPAHPSAAQLRAGTHPWYVTGPLRLREPVEHPDLPPLVRTPAEVRAEIARRGWGTVVAFNTRNPLHGAHRALMLRALDDVSARTGRDAALLLHPVVGQTRPGDVPAAVRARVYQAVVETLSPDRALLALLPLAMRMAGPREALWHAVLRRTFGATHFVVGRDQAAPGPDSHGKPFYGEYAAQDLVRRHETELGIGAVCLPELVYVDGRGYLPRDEVRDGERVRTVSGTRLRELLASGEAVPSWLAAPDVVAALSAAYALS